MEKTVLAAMALALKAYETEKNPGTEVIDDRVTGVQCFIRRRGETLIFAFRGSDSKKDWQTNLAFRQKAIPYGQQSSKIRVHSGFVDAYKAPQIRLRLQGLILPGVKRIAICGHSLGAALAVLCAADMQASFPDRQVEVILFGCPRVGNRAFRDMYDRRVPKTLRVENGNDIVTKIPLAIMGYRHVGVPLRIGTRRLPGIISFEQHRPENYCRELVKEKADPALRGLQS